MKKQLLSFCAAMAVAGAFAQQTPSPVWNPQNIPFPSNPAVPVAPGIEFLDAVDQNTIWAIGSDFAFPSRAYNWWARSTDGGNTWSNGYTYSVPSNPAKSDTNQFTIANMEGIDGQTAWISAFYKASNNPWQLNTQGNGAIHRTTNAGQTWVDMTAPGMFTTGTSFCNFVTFLTPQVGIAQGDPINLGGNMEYEIWRTTNGGLTWNLIPGSSIADPIVGEVAYVDVYAKLGTNYIWFGTNEGRIYRSIDAGLTWSVTTLAGAASGDDLLEIAFSSPLNGLALVNTGGIFAFWNTFDGGATWNSIASPVGNWGWRDLRNIPGTGVIASFGYGAAYSFKSYTSDNGQTWTDWGSVAIEYNYGDFVDNSTGWAAGYSSSQNQFTNNLWKYAGPPITNTNSATTPPLSAFSMPLQICLGSSPATVMPVNSSTGTPAPSFTWTGFPGGVTFSNPNTANPVITFASPGTYTVALAAGNGTTHASYQVVDVIACSQPAVDFVPAAGAICNNKAFVLNNQTTGGTPAPSYSWSAPTGVSFLPNAVALSPTVTAATPGSYVFTLTATNAAGTVSTTKTVVIDDCSPTAVFNIADTLYRCPHTNTFIIINPIANSSVTPAGNNTYSWSIQPSGTTPLTLVSLPSYSARATNSNVPTYTVTLRVTNASGTHTLSKVVRMSWNTTELFCDPTSGIAENANNLAIGIYPNPATTDITLKLADSRDVSVRLVNVLGSVVYDKKLESRSGNLNVNLANLPRGVYFITVESDGKKATRKVILE